LLIFFFKYHVCLWKRLKIPILNNQRDASPWLSLRTPSQTPKCEKYIRLKADQQWYTHVRGRLLLHKTGFACQWRWQIHGNEIHIIFIWNLVRGFGKIVSKRTIDQHSRSNLSGINNDSVFLGISELKIRADFQRYRLGLDRLASEYSCRSIKWNDQLFTRTDTNTADRWVMASVPCSLGISDVRVLYPSGWDPIDQDNSHAKKHDLAQGWIISSMSYHHLNPMPGP
jgi:hypothetical protein